MKKKLFKRALLTNDDGIESDGIKALAEVAALVAEEVWVVAPQYDQSGASACISLHMPLRVKEFGERKFAVAGTPCDSVLMAVRHMMKDTPPDVVMSGINKGFNISDDVLFSGTANAAMTGLFLGIPSVAFSQAYRDPNNLRWSAATDWIPRVLAFLSEGGWPEGVCFNVNFPDAAADDIKNMEIVRQGRGSILAVEVDQRVDLREKPYYWFQFTRNRKDSDEDTDVAALRRQSISITPLKLDRTDHDVLEKLRDKLTVPRT
jgi:5'-nucleotidase